MESLLAPVHQNGGFGSSFGLVLACMGSAVGMGDIWMFPYRVGQYGGGASLVSYIPFIVLSGLVGLSVGLAIGRRAKTGTLGAYGYCWNAIGKGKLGYILGWISLLGSLGIAIGYAIIVGWVVRALTDSLTGEILTQDAAMYFTQVTGNFDSMPWHVLVIVTATVILMFGATEGIEKINKVLMPSFLVLFAILAVHVASLPGAAEGYKFFFIPDWKNLLKVDTWVMAMGQVSLLLSIAGSGMIMYGTYLSRTEDIPKAPTRTVFFDTIAATMATLAIMPAVLAFGIEPNAGPPLMFITLPNIFRQIPMGRLFAALFFLSMAFAGITSPINMFEAVSKSWQTRFKLSRKGAVVLRGSIILLVGIFLEVKPSVGPWMDFTTIMVVPFGVALGAVSIYYILGYKEIKKELEEGWEKPLKSRSGPLAKFVYVPLAVVVSTLGTIYGGIG